MTITRSRLSVAVAATLAIVAGCLLVAASPAWAAAVAVDDAYGTASGTTLTVPAPGVLANDTGLPPNARATMASGVPANADAFQLGTDGSLSYTPRTGFNGTDTFKYCVEGGGLGSCQSNAATVTITVKAAPTISTQASPGGLLGAPVTDTATVTGGTNPTGTVTFRLFSDGACTVQVFTSTNALQGSTARSGSFTPTAAGTYRWTASYSGDAVNNPVSAPCNAPNESVTIAPFSPPPTTQTITGDFTGPVTVARGQSVLITNARVVGPVTVSPGGALTVVNSQISQGIGADGPAFFSLCGSQVSGPASIPGRGVVVRNAAVPLRIGDPAGGCATNRIAGDVILTGNTAGLTFGANVVSGNVTVDGNAGSTVLKANSIFKALSCTANNPPPTNAGQTNTAAAKAGQCAAL